MSAIDTGSKTITPGTTRTCDLRIGNPLIKNDNSQENKGLTDTSERRLQTSLQTNAENSQKSEQNLPPELAEIIEVWPELPKHIKQAISALVQTQIEQGSSMGGYYWKKKGNVEDCTKL